LSEKTDLRDLLKGLFSSQSLAVLATQNGGEPYACLVAFAPTDDLKHLIFATARGTRKYDNLIRNPLASVVIDNRTNREEDFRRAIAVTAMGAVEEVKEPDRSHFLEFYLAKHPHLNQFVTSPTSALLRIDVKVYYIVSQFQNVMKFHPDP
jgi:heme iron utilization protein